MFDYWYYYYQCTKLSQPFKIEHNIIYIMLSDTQQYMFDGIN